MKATTLFFLPLFAASLVARAPERHPRVKGVAHIAYYISDLSKARAYYEDFLGFDEAFVLKKSNGTDHVVFVKINDRQFIELVAEPATNHGFLHDVAFWTTDATAVRASLTFLGRAVSEVAKDQAGDLTFEITDPFGFKVQIVQYLAGSRASVKSARRMPGSPISDHIDHVGILTGNREAAAKFYADAFGFVSEGDGSKQRIGEGPDRFELGFERKPPTVGRFHVKNHICLSVPDVPKVVAMLQAKPAAKSFREIESHVLDNGKHVAELYDLDGNRVELMEPPKGAE
jgi:catechol 2,3-dioxygenase-like lactoylglutathione lyase family enzyme